MTIPLPVIVGFGAEYTINVIIDSAGNEVDLSSADRDQNLFILKYNSLADVKGPNFRYTFVAGSWNGSEWGNFKKIEVNSTLDISSINDDTCHEIRSNLMFGLNVLRDNLKFIVKYSVETQEER